MASSRRKILIGALASTLLHAQEQVPDEPNSNPHPRLPPLPNPDEDRKLPNGKSQKDAIARQEHQKALQDAQDLVSMAEQLRDELKNAGDFVVPMASVKKTEEIEKLARKIRGRLRE